MTHTVIAIAPRRFPLGDVVITTNANARLGPDAVARGLARHAQGDWGELDPHDTRQNEYALANGGRLFSAYGEGDDRFWIITECDRSVTTVLLPQDY